MESLFKFPFFYTCRDCGDSKKDIQISFIKRYAYPVGSAWYFEIRYQSCNSVSFSSHFPIYKPLRN